MEQHERLKVADYINTHHIGVQKHHFLCLHLGKIMCGAEVKGPRESHLESQGQS